MLIGGIILLIIAVICFFFARSQAKKLDAMNAADTYTSQMLTELHSKVVSTLGREALCETCDIEGIIECDAPLKAPLSGTPCVAYTVTVQREYEEKVTDTDSEGRKTTRVQRGSESMETNENKVDFWIRDDTGRVLVHPEQADLDLVQTKEQYQPAETHSKQVDFGLFNITIPAGSGGIGRQTLGYRATEQVLETGIRVYVLGCASDYNGQPAITVHPKSEGRFMISRRSERDLANSASATSRNLYFAAAGTGVLGMLLTILGLV
jgi:hypothetical protein